MRLTCPNCGARYEVDDSLIPAEGRDVQCSECSTTWFQAGPDKTPAPEEAAPPAAKEWAEEHEERSTDETSPQPRPDTVADLAAALSSDAETATQVVTRNDAPAEPETSDPASRSRLAPAIRDILKSEAEREARLRRASADPVESQAEMPLDEEPDLLRRARRRADLESDPEAATGETDPEEGTQQGLARRELLPDIEEINSTLRSNASSATPAAETDDVASSGDSTARSSVRTGFLVTIMIVALLAAAYLNAEFVASQAPGLAPVMDGFVDAVDGVRLWLDDVARGLVESDT